MLFCNAPKNKGGGINLLDLKKLAFEHGIEFPDDISKRDLCKLVNKKIENLAINLSTTTRKNGKTAAEEPKPEKTSKNVEKLLDLYKMVKKLGEGSFGEVWQAEEISTGQMHALKLLKETDETTDREVATLIEMSRVENGKCPQNILCYIRQFSAWYKDRNYEIIVTDMIQGKTLEKWIKNWYKTHADAPPLKTIKKITLGLFEALATAHENGIYHLDIKPQNIMIRDDDEVVVIDFGIACTYSKSLLRETNANNCKGVLGWGSQLFMSPEYLKNCHIARKGSMPCDEETLEKTDIWAAGLTILFLIHNFLPEKNIAAQFKETQKFVQWLSNGSWIPRPIYAENKKIDRAINDALLPQDERPTAKKIISLIK